MAEKYIDIAMAVIRASSRQAPADAVLRAELRNQKGIDQETARRASAAVFAYYRWLGWLERTESLPARIKRARQLQARFDSSPGDFAPEELRRRAIPAWVPDQVEVTLEWLKALQTEPKLWLRARQGRGQDLVRELGDSRSFGEDGLPDTLLYSGGRDLFRTPQFQAGDFEIQDLSSQLVVVLCEPEPGQIWWDACAGEGGKTLHLSALMENRGLIWASDRARWRLQKLRLRAARARAFNYRAALWDGSAKLPTKTKFDGILVDAPCSGLGTWHRNPHARWTTTPEDIRELKLRQQRLLAHAAAALKPGGKLIYAVCTVTRAETVEVTAAVQQHLPGLQPLSLSHPLARGSHRSQCWFWPQECGGNGMFVAGWKG